MEIYQLRAFVAVAKHGSFTRAADELHLSQPTVSGQIKALEADLGVLLFDRTVGGVVLTNSGTQLLQRAEKLLVDVRGFIAHAKGLGAQASRVLRLGVPGDADTYRYIEMLSEMRAEHPHIGFEACHGLSGWVMNAIRKGDLDCGYFVGSVTESDVLATHLTTVTYRVVAPASWAEKLEGASWAEIVDVPWVWTPELGAPRRIATEMFREHGVEPRRATVADRESTVIELVAAGVGMALLAEKTAIRAIDQKSIIFWGNESRQTPVSFVCLAERQGDPAIQAAIATVTHVWSK
jgi:DNA-binding transcriptional LysR family regulator